MRVSPACWLTTAGVSSVEPSSAMSSSQSAIVCARTVAMAPGSQRTWL
jgi:hypothetical protein